MERHHLNSSGEREFLDRNKLQRALLITLDTETKFQKEKLIVDAVPYWKYWSIKQKTG